MAAAVHGPPARSWGRRRLCWAPGSPRRSCGHGLSPRTEGELSTRAGSPSSPSQTQTLCSDAEGPGHWARDGEGGQGCTGPAAWASAVGQSTLRRGPARPDQRRGRQRKAAPGPGGAEGVVRERSGRVERSHGPALGTQTWSGHRARQDGDGARRPWLRGSEHASRQGSVAVTGPWLALSPCEMAGSLSQARVGRASRA